MKKTKILIPALVVASSMPLLVVASCNDEHKDIDKYEIFKIDLNAIQDIVSLKDIQFLQGEALTYGPSGVQWGKEWMSPSVFYSISSGLIEVYERCIYDENGTMMEKQRLSTSSWQWSAPFEAIHQFRKPSMLGNAFIEYCNAIKLFKASLTFSEEKLCYQTSFDNEGTTNTYEFYFVKNKLVKCVSSFDTHVGAWGTTINSLSYDEQTPVIPATA